MSSFYGLFVIYIYAIDHLTRSSIRPAPVLLSVHSPLCTHQHKHKHKPFFITIHTQMHMFNLLMIYEYTKTHLSPTPRGAISGYVRNYSPLFVTGKLEKKTGEMRAELPYKSLWKNKIFISF